MKNEEIIKKFEERGWDEQSAYEATNIFQELLFSALEAKDKEIIKWAERMLEDKEISNGYFNAMHDLIKFLKENERRKQTNSHLMSEEDYGYEYPIKAVRYKNWEISVRKMRKDEMLDDGITYYVEQNGTIYIEGEKDFELLST